MDKSKAEDEERLGTSQNIQQLAMKLVKNSNGLQQSTAAIFDTCEHNEQFTRTMRENVARLKVSATEIMRFLSCAVTSNQAITMDDLFERLVDTNDDVLERIRSYLDQKHDSSVSNVLAAGNGVASPNTSKQGAELFVVRRSGGNPSAFSGDGTPSQSPTVVTVSKLGNASNVTGGSPDERKAVASGNDSIISITGTPSSLASASRRNERSRMYFSSLIAGKNILRPQVAFRVRKPDNSLEPFRVALRVLPHATVSRNLPLSEAYAREISQFEAHPALLRSYSQFEHTEAAGSSTRLELVEKVDSLRKLVAALSTDYPYFAIDVEHHSYRTYLGLTCLVQISTPAFRYRKPRALSTIELQALGLRSAGRENETQADKEVDEEFEACEAVDYVIDALALHDELDMLNVATTNPRTLKIAHGAQSDVLWLQRDFSVFFVGLFDSQVAFDVVSAKRQRQGTSANEQDRDVNMRSPSKLKSTSAEPETGAKSTDDLNQKVQLADTPQMNSELASIPLVRANVSLEALLNEYVPNVTLEKRFQFADWRIRPLPADLLDYARADTHHLLRVFALMKRDLNELELRAVLEHSKRIASKRYHKPGEEFCVFLESSNGTARDANTKRISLQNRTNYETGFLRREASRLLERLERARKATAAQRRAVELLVTWRDHTAREQDESPHYVLPTHQLLKIAEVLPRETSSILACCNPLPPLVRQHALELHQLILVARSTPNNADLQSDAAKPLTGVNRLFAKRRESQSNVNDGQPLSTQHSSSFALDSNASDLNTSSHLGLSKPGTSNSFRVPLKRRADLCLDHSWLSAHGSRNADTSVNHEQVTDIPLRTAPKKQKLKKSKKNKKAKNLQADTPKQQKGKKKVGKKAAKVAKQQSNADLSSVIRAKFSNQNVVQSKKKKNQNKKRLA